MRARLRERSERRQERVNDHAEVDSLPAVRPPGRVRSPLMADPSGMQAALNVEAVEWARGDDDKLTVSVRGRWRRRRPPWRGQPMLLIEAEGHRHRFPATPEPPSVGGAPPGGWQMTFSGPAWLAPHLGGRAWLQLGLATIPLPAPIGPAEGSEASAPGAGAPDESAVADRRVRAAEGAAQIAAERQVQAEAIAAALTERVRLLEGELERAREEPERLRELAAERERARRAAEQRARAEQALRTPSCRGDSSRGAGRTEARSDRGRRAGRRRGARCDRGRASINRAGGPMRPSGRPRCCGPRWPRR